MFVQSLRLPMIAFVGVVLVGNVAWALGFVLGESKEQLGLKYDVSVEDHHTGRVTVHLTIADQGRLKPLDSVELVIPNGESQDGSGTPDLSAALAMREVDGKLSVSVHLTKEMAERAELQLRTSALDGKVSGLTWYSHAIHVAKYLKDVGRK